MYTVLGVGWYVYSGAWRHIMYDRKIFSTFQEQGGMLVELVDDATYLMKSLGSISFQMLSGDVLELDSIFYVLDLMKSLL
jgi:hypothetical protein